MLSEVKFSEGLSVIGQEAFSSCVSLQAVDFPKSVGTVKGYAFKDCANLHRLNITNSDIRLGGEGYCSAFCGCALNELHLCGSLKNIGMNAFGRNFAKWVKIFVPSLSAWFAQDTFSRVGCYKAPCNYDLYVNNVLLESVTINEKVPPYGFSDCHSLKSVEFGSSVEEIGESAFSYSGLTDLYIPQTVVAIADGAFESCTDLKHVKLPSAYRARVSSIFKYCDYKIQFEFYD